MQRIAVLLTLLLSIAEMQAQDPLYQRLTTRNGLVSNTIYSLAQDPEGFIWFGTDAGAVRYDGTHLDAFGVSEGLTDNEVFKVEPDRQGRMWFLTGNGKPCYYADGKLYGPLRDPALAHVCVRSGILSMQQDAQGALWFGGLSGELVVLDPDGAVQEDYIPDPVSLLAGGHIGLATETNGDIMVFSGAVRVVRSGKGQGSSRVDSSLYVSVLGAFPDGRLLCTAPNVVKEWKDNDWVDLVTQAVDPATGPFRRAYSLGPDELWVTLQQGGVLWLERREGRWEKVRGPLFPGDLVNDVKRDNEGNIWLATAYGGVIMMTGSATRTAFFGVGNDRGEELQRAYLDTVNGVLWCGTNRGDLFRLFHDFEHVDLPPDEEIFSRVTDMTMLGTDLIVATDHHCFRVHDPNGQRVVEELKSRHLRHWKGKVRGGMKSVVVAPDGTLAASAYGLFTMVPDSSSLVRVDPSLVPDLRIYAPAYDALGTLWYEDNGSLLSLAKGVVQEHAAVELAPGIRITDLVVLGDTVVVATSGAGILFYAQGRVVQRVTTTEGLAANAVSHLFAEGGDLFVAMNEGLDRITDLHLAAPKVLHYDLAMGSQGQAVRDVVADRQHAYVVVEDGLCLLPRAISSAALSVPMPYIRAVLVNDSAIADRTIVGIRRGSARLSVELGVVHFGSPDRVRLEYRLSEKDTWRSAPKGQLDLTALDAGDHVLQVRASLLQGAWSVPVELKVVMIPKMWERWWVQVLAAAFLIGLVIAVVRIIIYARFRRREEQVREQVLVAQERQRIARDLHDDLGAELSSLLLLTRLQRERPASEGMDRLEAMTGTLAEKMKEVIWSTDPGHDTLDGTISFIDKHLAAVCARHGLRLRTVLAEALPHVPLGAGARREVYLIAKEALNNALKHSGATTFSMEVQTTPIAVQITFADDGVGLAHEYRGRGLDNMIDRAAAIGGTIGMEGDGPGTRITLILPLAAHHPSR